MPCSYFFLPKARMLEQRPCVSSHPTAVNWQTRLRSQCEMQQSCLQEETTSSPTGREECDYVSDRTGVTLSIWLYVGQSYIISSCVYSHPQGWSFFFSFQLNFRTTALQSRVNHRLLTGKQDCARSARCSNLVCRKKYRALRPVGRNATMFLTEPGLLFQYGYMSGNHI